jgi:5-methylcytosine-specific restriction endonuclease McrA
MSVRRRGEFYKTSGWVRLRKQRLAFAHGECECCGALDELQLDHIEARANGSDHRRLGLHDVQILCRRCNQLKGTSSLTATQLRELLSIEPPRHRSVFSAKPRSG